MCFWEENVGEKKVKLVDQRRKRRVPESSCESEVAQSCPTLCDPMDCSLPGSSVHGIFQARLLEGVAISFSSGSSQRRDRTRVSHTASRRFTIWATRGEWLSKAPSWHLHFWLCWSYWYQIGPTTVHVRVLSHFSSAESLWLHGLSPTRLLCPQDYPGNNNGVGCHALLQGIFPNQGSNLGLLCLIHWQADSLPLAPRDSQTLVKEQPLETGELNNYQSSHMVKSLH